MLVQRTLDEAGHASEITVQLAPVPNRVVFHKTVSPASADPQPRYEPPRSRTRGLQAMASVLSGGGGNNVNGAAGGAGDDGGGGIPVASLSATSASEMAMPKLALFPHVAGSRVARGLFENSFVHPDGTAVFYYCKVGGESSADAAMGGRIERYDAPRKDRHSSTQLGVTIVTVAAF